MPDLTKFQRIVERLMTDEEVKDRCREENLSENVTSFILKHFRWARETTLQNPSVEDRMARGNGRLGCGQSHQDVYDELAAEMGRSPEDPWVAHVWGLFFDE